MSESETVHIALITAGSGIVGAALGAIAAVIGPWWVKKTEINEERARNDKEEMRRALVDLSVKYTEAILEFYQVFSFGKKNSDIVNINNQSNNAITELYSRVKKEDAGFKSWMNGFFARSRAFQIKGVEDLGSVSAFVNVGFLHAISWHVGELSTHELKPFGLDAQGNTVWLSDWNDEWPSN